MAFYLLMCENVAGRTQFDAVIERYSQQHAIDFARTFTNTAARTPVTIRAKQITNDEAEEIVAAGGVDWR